MLKKSLLAAVLIICCNVVAFTQAKPKLGILPFSGPDGGTVAELFSHETVILDAYTVVPRTKAVDALVNEQQFQTSGYTDSDTIAGIGKMLNADFVLSGHVRRLGDSRVVITTIINVETFEQIAGDFHEFLEREDIKDFIPAIARAVVSAAKKDTSKLPKLAIAPFSVANVDVNEREAETLAQILAVEIGNTGKYSVLPRTTTLRAAMKEQSIQMSGMTDDAGAKALGRAINAEYVLNAEVRKLGKANVFTVSVLKVEDGTQLAGGSRQYETIADGTKLMKELALIITGDSATAAKLASAREAEEKKQAKALQNQEKKAQQQAANAARKEAAGSWFASAVADDRRHWSASIDLGLAGMAPMLSPSLSGTAAPLPYSFLELGCDVGFISGLGENAKESDYFSLYPFAHYALNLPFKFDNPRFGSWYVGVGGGYMFADYKFHKWESFPEGTEAKVKLWAFDVVAGAFKLIEIKGANNTHSEFNGAYILRMNFADKENTKVYSKLSVGYTYRF